MITFHMTGDHYQECEDEIKGFCIKCGMEHFGIEPDARKYECEACGENAVFGMQELLLEGHIVILPEEGYMFFEEERAEG